MAGEAIVLVETTPLPKPVAVPAEHMQPDEELVWSGYGSPSRAFILPILSIVVGVGLIFYSWYSIFVEQRVLDLEFNALSVERQVQAGVELGAGIGLAIVGVVTVSIGAFHYWCVFRTLFVVTTKRLYTLPPDRLRWIPGGEPAKSIEMPFVRYVKTVGIGKDLVEAEAESGNSIVIDAGDVTPQLQRWLLEVAAQSIRYEWNREAHLPDTSTDDRDLFEPHLYDDETLEYVPSAAMNRLDKLGIMLTSAFTGTLTAITCVISSIHGAQNGGISSWGTALFTAITTVIMYRVAFLQSLTVTSTRWALTDRRILVLDRQCKLIASYKRVDEKFGSFVTLSRHLRELRISAECQETKPPRPVKLVVYPGEAETLSRYFNWLYLRREREKEQRTNAPSEAS